jgi:sugar lactone lactonase YvrE
MHATYPSRFALAALLLSFCAAAPAQGTRQWTESRFEQFEKGTPHNAAIRNDGVLEAAPTLTTRFVSPNTYLWSLDADEKGNACFGTGATSGGSSVVCVTPDGHPTTRAHFDQLGVQALHMLPDGAILAATSPDGKLYRIAPGSALDLKPQVLFDPVQTQEKPKYLWALAITGKDVLVATGVPAAIYRVPLAGGPASIFFRSGDQHIRSLALAPNGTLYAGSDGSGVVYRIAPDGKAFALYTASRREITSLALDAAGNLYLAAVGDKHSSTLPPLSPQGTSGIIGLPSLSATTNALVPEGSEIDRISPDGAPLRLVTLKDDVVYALTLRHDTLFAASGNHGRIYHVDTTVAGRYTDLGHVDAAQATAFASFRDGLLIVTSNTGKLLALSDAVATDASYMSDVFDAQSFAQWGRVETVSATADSPLAQLSLRTGNVESPNSTAGDLWSEWKPMGSVPPSARYAQWKADLPPGVALRSVAVNYLQKNLAPQVDDIVVQIGARMPVTPPPPTNSVSIVFTPPTPTMPDAGAGPLTAQRDRGAITLRWLAHDDNNDDLMFSVSYRDVHEKNWHLLREKISERFLSFDANLLPDGQYELRVTASDAPMHTDADTLTSQRVSTPFTLDTTAPIPGALAARIENGKLHATFEAHDATSPITHAEYSVDAGPWQFADPVDHISDAQTEHYDFTVALPAPLKTNDPSEHVIAMRVYDRYDNVVSAKAIAH